DISVSPDEINVTNDNQEVIATVSVSDPSGIDLAALPNPYWYQVDDVQGTRIDSVWELTSGDEFNATFISTVIIPMGAKGGTWRVGSTAFRDNLGYRSTNGGHETTFTVTSSSTFDTDGPTVGDISVSPDEINVTNDNQEVIATVSVSDPSGIDLAALPNPYWYQVDDVQGTRIDSVWELTSGDEFNATF
ncbi:hypothetical protein Q4493_17725, partial [Colwellia sp. 1_MG-2023]|uniref:hypothetical protein n=1 Tax=Colwellia sp. 1_MG-2023 TaxID=3062649 RepID=UPI0026E37917